MAYTIVRIEPVGNVTAADEKDREPDIAYLHKRSRFGDPPIAFVRALCARNGFDIEMGIGPGSWPVSEWPFIAYVYTSRRKDGHGRCGSTLYRWPCRHRG